jgi:hypothetical protein
MKKLTQERLKELLHYDPETGIFTRKCDKGGCKKGSIVTSTQMMSVDGKEHSILRLIWLYEYGHFPTKNIKRIDGNLQNNKLNNLQENISHKENPKKLTQERLKKLLHYDPETGVFTRKISTTSNAQRGNIAGTICKNGYAQAGVEGKRYYLHRLAWLYMYGYLPENEIDHIDRNPLNNRINNLREVSRSCNAKNVSPMSNCKTGIPGVFFNKKTKKWWVYISLGPKTKRGWLGQFKEQDFDEAVCTRLAAEQCLNYNQCNSQSPAYQYVQKMLRKKKRKVKRRKILTKHKDYAIMKS